jgi:hypothetical protein
MMEPLTGMEVEIIDEEESGEKVIGTGRKHWHGMGNQHVNWDFFSRE